MTTTEIPSERDRLRAMIKARNDIQNELVDLLDFKTSYGKELQVSAYLRVTGLLVSAGFSLWRAAFLFEHEDGKHQQYLDNAEKFLRRIISTNNIAYMDDQNTWSLWHYIGAARSSLLEATTLLASPPPFNQVERIANKLVDAPLLTANVAVQWNELLQIMKQLRKICGNRIDIKNSMQPLFEEPPKG